jgi:hypothetical protein
MAKTDSQRPALLRPTPPPPPSLALTGEAQYVFPVAVINGGLQYDTTTPISSVSAWSRIRLVSTLCTHRLDRVGVCLAIGSGILIGSSFVFKKKGLLNSQRGQVAGEGVAYLKSVRDYLSSFTPCYPSLT